MKTYFWMMTVLVAVAMTAGCAGTEWEPTLDVIGVEDTGFEEDTESTDVLDPIEDTGVDVESDDTVDAESTDEGSVDVCIPECPINTCGDDGCGGSCTCSGGLACNNSDGTCSRCLEGPYYDDSDREYYLDPAGFPCMENDTGKCQNQCPAGFQECHAEEEDCTEYEGVKCIAPVPTAIYGDVSYVNDLKTGMWHIIQDANGDPEPCPFDGTLWLVEKATIEFLNITDTCQ